MTEERLADIEIKLAHQDQQIAGLNDAVLRQGREIELLNAKLRRAEERLQDVSQSLEDNGKPLSPSEIAARDKPPHY
jgi:SlyX protein